MKAFWEGFDAAGDTLRCVVIPKLPFASPSDPLSCERGAREDRAWARYSLPEAVLEVKQAAGRLIRTSTDAGVLVLADSRLVSKGYGKKFLNSLPAPHQRIEVRQVGRYLEMWRESHERR
ncbi:putative ATP-dependent helicase DinG [Collinsella intestinalis]|nr:putative ATP-dependent helicase DinG [Collinsella intestinalis]